MTSKPTQPMQAAIPVQIRRFLFLSLSAFGMILFGYEKGRKMKRSLRRYFRPYPVVISPAKNRKSAAVQTTYRPVFTKPVLAPFYRPLSVSLSGK